MNDRRNGCPTRAKMCELVLQLYREHQKDRTLPTSIRFLFYEGVARGWWPKSWERSGTPSSEVMRATVILREADTIPWEDIADETRSVEDYRGGASIVEELLLQLDYACLDRWAGRPPFLIMESRSLVGAMRETCREYGVVSASSNGQTIGFLHTDAIPRLSAGQRVLYFGDLDLAGADIETNTRGILEREVGPLEWERLMLTEAQVRRYKLLSIIKTDNRFKDGGAHEAVETEALSQKLIVKLLRNRLNKLLPEPLAGVQEREARERTKVRRYLEEMR